MSQSTILRTVSRNIASSWVAMAIQATVVFFLTPFVLKTLGSTRYGVWALVTSLTGYYGLLDFGFRAGMTQYLTRYLATKDFVKMNAIASAGFVALICSGCLVLVGTLIVTWLAPRIFTIPPDLVSETQWCILTIGLGTASGFGFQPFAAVLPAVQRHDVKNAVFIGAYLLSAVGTLIALNLGYGLVTLSIILAGSNFLMYTVTWRLAYRVLPELTISPRLVNRENFRQIVSFGGWNFLINGANILKSRADVVLIGILLPIEAIAPYVLALSLVGYFERIFTPIGFVFSPALTHLDARGDTERLKKAYLSGTKLLMLLAIAVATLSAIWAADFFHLWITTDITHMGAFPSPSTLYIFLVIGAACAASQTIGIQVCVGTRNMKSLAAILTCEIVLNIGLSIVLALRFGLIGIALGTLLTAIIFQTIVLPANVLRIVGVGIRDYLQFTCIRPLLMLIVVASLLGPIMYAIPAITSWPKLFLFATLTGVATGIPLALIGLTHVERQRFILEPLITLGHAIKKPMIGQDSH